MKKVLFLIIVFFANYPAHAQSNKFEIGIEGGPDGANSLIISKNQSGHNLVNWEYQAAVSFSSGITCLYEFSERFSIRTGLLYQQDASNFIFSLNEINSTSSYVEKLPIMYDYLVLPVLARYTIGHRVRFFVNGGPYMGYLLKSTIQGYFNSPEYKSTLNTTNSEYRVDFGVAAGIGVGMKIANRFSLELETRGNYGLVNVNKANTSFNEARNISGNLLIGLRYNLGKGK